MHPELGPQGEILAEHFLRRKGWSILERNWRAARGEIDLIAMDQGCLVFVEVKTRSTSRYGPPEHALNYRKRHLLARTAHHYLRSRQLVIDCRFDLLAIIVQADRIRYQHFRDVFWPGVFH